jgi:hypothetical protein
MRVEARAVFDCEPQTYFEQLFDPETRKRREMEGRKAKSYRIVESNTDSETWHQIAESVEHLDAPRAVRKVLGETTTIREEVTWKKGAYRAEVSYRPDKLADRTKVAGTLEAEPEGSGSCRVTLAVEVKIKVFGVGGMIEKMSAGKLREDFQKDADFFNREIAPNL